MERKRTQIEVTNVKRKVVDARKGAEQPVDNVSFAGKDSDRRDDSHPSTFIQGGVIWPENSFYYTALRGQPIVLNCREVKYAIDDNYFDKLFDIKHKIHLFKRSLNFCPGLRQKQLSSSTTLVKINVSNHNS